MVILSVSEESVFWLVFNKEGVINPTQPPLWKGREIESPSFKGGVRGG
jgi:hypothetical protein